jgi:hypothetical protein
VKSGQTIFDMGFSSGTWRAAQGRAAPPLRKNQLAGVVETPKHESKRNKNKSVETVTFTPPKKNLDKIQRF